MDRHDCDNIILLSILNCQAALGLVCEDCEPEPVEAAGASELLGAADDSRGDPESRDDGEGGEDQTRVSRCIDSKIRKI